MSGHDPLADLNLLDFQRDTAHYVHDRLFKHPDRQKRFLIADEVGLGKTKVAQGVIALATARRARNVIYVASSGHIVTQNLDKLATRHVTPAEPRSLSLLAETLHQRDMNGKLIGLTPIKDLHDDHFGSVRERMLLLKLLSRRHRTLTSDAGVRDFFRGSRVTESTFLTFQEGGVPSSLRDEFEAALDPSVIDQLSDAGSRDKHKRAIVGKLRATLAGCALKRLNPALVIVDEIQRFSSDLMPKARTPQVASMLKCPVLVLSATPYQADVRKEKPEPHKGFMELVRFLNPGKSETIASVERALAEMRASLEAKPIERARVFGAAMALQTPLRTFMVRTERPSTAHVERKELAAPLSSDDLRALRQAMHLLKQARPSGKDKRHRTTEFVELWKSAPYMISAVGDRYVVGRDLTRMLEKSPRRLPAPAALTSAQLERTKPLADLAHPRLRALAQAMGNDARARRLWLPPTVPYIEDAGRSPDDPPSKTLIFTSWSAAPPAIATALNLHVELRPGRPKDLEFARTAKGGGAEVLQPAYVLAAPLWRLADYANPFHAMWQARAALPPPEMIARIRAQLVESGLLKVSRVARSKNAVDAAMELNARGSFATPGAYVESALAQMGSKPTGDFTISSEVANELAEIAAASPGTCAYRSLLSAIPALAGEEHRRVLLDTSMTIGASITRLFQRPAATAIVESGRWKPKAPYWRRVLRFCLDHDLQSVLDEYVFLLARDSSPRNSPREVAQDIAQKIQLALKTVGTVQAVRPKRARERDAQQNVAGKNRPASAMFARALGEPESPEEDAPVVRGRERGAKARSRGGRHASALLTAFNSPFPPFVLATTSTGQEGLDMHRYCRRVAHWNLPSSPLALEQREGRIDRFLSLGVRTNIAKLGFAAGEGVTAPRDVWGTLIDRAKAASEAHKSPLAPLWHFGDGQPIKALAINVPFSREQFTWERLTEDASWYRLVLGQSDSRRLLERLSNAGEENQRQIAGIRIDLSPQPAMDKQAPVKKRRPLAT